MEVLAERVVQVAQQLLQSTAELKRRAFLAHAGARLATPQSTADHTASDMQEYLGQLKANIERTLQVHRCGTGKHAHWQSRLLDANSLMQQAVCVQDVPAGKHATFGPGSEFAQEEAKHLAHLHHMMSSLSAQRRDGLG